MASAASGISPTTDRSHGRISRRSPRGSPSLDESLVRRVSITELGLRARRPAFSALDSERGKVMPTLERGVTEYLASPINVWRERRSRSRVASGHR